MLICQVKGTLNVYHHEVLPVGSNKVTKYRILVSRNQIRETNSEEERLFFFAALTDAILVKKHRFY